MIAWFTRGCAWLCILLGGWLVQSWLERRGRSTGASQASSPLIDVFIPSEKDGCS